MAEPREMVAEPTEAGTLGRPLLRFAAIALGAIGLTGIAAAILLTIEALLESAGGGIGSFAVFAIPYFVVLFIVATFVFATARAVARGEFLRTGACMAVIVASTALIFATNGQWFRRGLDFETHRCGAKSCYVLYGAASPRVIAIGAIPVAIWGALAAAAIAGDAFRKVGGRRSVVVASAVAMVAISVGGVY